MAGCRRRNARAGGRGLRRRGQRGKGGRHADRARGGLQLRRSGGLAR